MDEYTAVKKPISKADYFDEKDEVNIEERTDMTEFSLEDIKTNDTEFIKINELYDECVNYLKEENFGKDELNNSTDPDYESIKDKYDSDEQHEVKYEFEANNEDGHEVEAEIEKEQLEAKDEVIEKILKPKMIYKVENELISNDSIDSIKSESRSDRLRKLSKTLPKIIITQSNTSLNVRRHNVDNVILNWNSESNNIKAYYELNNLKKEEKIKSAPNDKKKAFDNHVNNRKSMYRARPGFGDFPKRLVSKRGIENIAVISNVPFEKIRLLNDTFHTLINLRWRWIVTGTIVVHFAIWLIFAVFWYITALAHYDFEPDPPKRTCVTGGYDFLTIFLASVEAQTTIGFGDRAIDEECPESIFLFIMQLILGTGLSGVLTCVVYAKLTRPEKLSRDGVGFSKKAVISMRDGKLCLMMRAWDLNYDHIISSEFNAHFVHTHRTKEGEIIRYFAQTLALQQRQFLLWPVTLVHVIDEASPLYKYGPEHISNSNYEITVSLKGASASMGTFTQSQTSYLPKEVLWGHRFPPVVKYDGHKQKYVIDHKKLDATEAVDAPFCSAEEFHRSSQDGPPARAGTPSSFSEKISSFQLGRSSSFRKKTPKG